MIMEMIMTMMKKLFAPIAATALVLLVAGIALAQPDRPQSVNVVRGDNDVHGNASANFAGASAFDQVSLSRGDWQITLSGAITLDGNATALNCGLRIPDAASPTGFIMIAKQNSAVGGEEGRVGFAVVGGLTVQNAPMTVEAVCYGGNEDGMPFEHNLVAVGGVAVGGGGD